MSDKSQYNIKRNKNKTKFIEITKYSPNFASKERINELITIVKNKESSTISHDKYSVLEEDGSNILVLKRQASTDPILQVLPTCELFDVMADTCLIYPESDLDGLLTKLKSKYYIPLICEEWFSKIFTEENYIYSLECGIMTINKEPDIYYNFVLVCVDTKTNYTYFRPLITKNHNEIAIEFIKLFSDIGIPSEVKVCVHNIFESVFNYMITTFEFISVPKVIYKKHLKKLMNCTKILIAQIKIWMEETECNNWALGLGYVQWFINTQQNNNDKKRISKKDLDNLTTSPYYEHFGCKPKLKSIIHNFQQYDITDGMSEFVHCICPVCNKQIHKKVVCDYCKTTVHAICSKVTLIHAEINILEVKCLLCNK